METTEPTIAALVLEKLEEIRALCREFGVAKLELFGSAATGEFDPARSDVDFIVTYPPGYDMGPWLGRFQDFQAALEAVMGRKVDLMESGAEIRNPYRWQSIDSSRRIRFGAPPRAAAYLWDIAETARFCAEHSAGLDFAGYLTDRQRRYAIERSVGIAGQSAEALIARDPERAEQLPGLDELAALRPHLLHDYDRVDDERVWRAVTELLPALRERSEAMLAAIERSVPE